jgi:hypothetical protein
MYRYSKKKFGVLCILALFSCGTIIGNGVRGDPTTPPVNNSGYIPNRPLSFPLNFSAPVHEYNVFSRSLDCGAFTEESTPEEVGAVDYVSPILLPIVQGPSIFMTRKTPMVRDLSLLSILTMSQRVR